MQNVSKCKVKPLAGTSYDEIYPSSRLLYKKIASNTKRKPYLRSRYFQGQKVFLDMFWEHLYQKRMIERATRLKYLPCAFDLIKNSCCEPDIKESIGRIFYRFYGVVLDGSYFCVQIRRDKKTNGKWFMSVFPKKKKLLR